MSAVKLSRIRVGFQVLLHVVLLTHVLAYYFLDSKRVGAIDFQAFFRYFLGDGLLTAGAIFTLLMFAGAFAFGRFFCSWGCHFGATQDLAAWVLRRLGWKPPLMRTRFLQQTPYLVLFFVFLLPLIERWRAGRWGPLRVDLAAVAPWDTLPGWLLSLVTFLACGAGILLFLGTRGFCRFVCPYGAIFRLTNHVTPWHVRRVSSCSSECAPGGVHPCTAACPTAIDVHGEVNANGRVVSADCVRCNLCVEACPGSSLSVTTERRARSLIVSVPQLVRHTAHIEPPQGPRHDLPAWGEALVFLVGMGTYSVSDLVYGGHFLAATLGLGEGFLALTVLRTLGGAQKASVLGRPLRQGRSWTLMGISCVGLLALSFVPLFEAGAFKWLRWEGLRLDPATAISLDPVEERPASPASLEKDLSLSRGALDPQARQSLEAAASFYRRALDYFPSQLETRYLLLSVYARLGDRRAVEEAEELARKRPGDPEIRELCRWVHLRFRAPPPR